MSVDQSDRQSSVYLPHLQCGLPESEPVLEKVSIKCAVVIFYD